MILALHQGIDSLFGGLTFGLGFLSCVGIMHFRTMEKVTSVGPGCDAVTEKCPSKYHLQGFDTQNRS